MALYINLDLVLERKTRIFDTLSNSVEVLLICCVRDESKLMDLGTTGVWCNIFVFSFFLICIIIVQDSKDDTNTPEARKMHDYESRPN